MSKGLMSKVSNAKGSNVKKVQMPKNSNVKRFICQKVQMSKGSNVKRFKCQKVQMSKGSNVKRFKCLGNSSTLQRNSSSSITVIYASLGNHFSNCEAVLFFVEWCTYFSVSNNYPNTFPYVFLCMKVFLFVDKNARIIPLVLILPR